MVGDRVGADAAVDGIIRGAVVPHVAHHVPARVVGRAVGPRRVRQPEAVSHLVRDRALALVAPGRQPGDAVCAPLAVEVEVRAPAPGAAVEVVVEHHVDADEARKVHVGVGDGRAIAGGALGIELERGAVDVVGPRSRQRVPAEHDAAGEVDGAERRLAPVVVEAGGLAAEHERLEPRLRIRRDVRGIGEAAEDRYPLLRSADESLAARSACCLEARGGAVDCDRVHFERRRRPRARERHGGENLTPHGDAAVVDRGAAARRGDHAVGHLEPRGPPLVVDEHVRVPVGAAAGCVAI